MEAIAMQNAETLVLIYGSLVDILGALGFIFLAQVVQICFK